MSLLTFVTLFFLQLSHSIATNLVLPLTKHPSTHHYSTRIYHGSVPEPVSLLVDLNSPFLWLHCSSSSNQTTVNCRSIQCTSAAPNPCPSSSTNQVCSLPLINPTTGDSLPGELVDSAISFDKISTVDSFLISCAPSKLLTGLPSSSSGVFGLGRTRIGPVSQIGHLFEYPLKFSICLPSGSGTGMVLFGNDKVEEFKSMIYTPLINNNGDSSYSISLKSVKIQNKKLPLDENNYPSTVKISTVDEFTKMETRVYQEFVQAFVTEAESLNSNLIRVPPQGRFEVCFGVQGFTISPVVDLVLQSEMVKWRIYGHNSMVKINDDVMCLGYLDGGYDMKGLIILGAHQIQDNLLEFDLGSSMLGFTSSLLKLQTSCSQLTSSAMEQQHSSLQSY